MPAEHLSPPPHLPVSEHCTVLASKGVAGARIELRSFDWRQVHEATFTARQGYIEFTHVDGRARYLERRGAPLVPQGAVRYVPAGHAFYCRWAADRQKSLQCALDIEALTGEPLVVPPQRLHETFDLHDDGLRRLLTLMQQEIASPGLASEALLSAHSTALAVILLRRFAAQAAPAHSRGTRLGRRHLDELVMRLREEGRRPSLESLAAEHGLSARHYARLFQQTAGQGFADFVAMQTASFARDLLREPHRPVKEVALRCGFSDTAAFSKAFRRTTGHSPLAYRRDLNDD